MRLGLLLNQSGFNAPALLKRARVHVRSFSKPSYSFVPSHNSIQELESPSKKTKEEENERRSRNFRKNCLAILVGGSIFVGGFFYVYIKRLAHQERVLALHLEAIPEETSPVFDMKHFGPGGPNSKFFQSDAVSFFAGGAHGGGGVFESEKERDIARSKRKLVEMLQKQGLKEGGVVLDVGAGTGLMLSEMSRAVGPKGFVLGVEISDKFCDFMRQRIVKEKLGNVEIRQCTDDAVNAPVGVVDVAFICDVYHHFVKPKTYMRSIGRALKPGGKVVLIDFHRDPSKMVSHPPQWAIDHIRAGKEDFTKEIESAGFEFLGDVDFPELVENYVMVFGRSIDKHMRMK